MEFLKIYRNVKDIFVPPRLKWYFGTWKKEPNLPVWRMGPQIRWSNKKSWQLPIWLSFYLFDSDIYWKTKWDEYRYEYPAHITLVFFGLAISVTALPPKVNNELTLEEDYWETILTYERDMSIEKLNKMMGYWKSIDNRKHYVVDPKFFKDENIQKQLIQLQNGSDAS